MISIVAKAESILSVEHGLVAAFAGDVVAFVVELAVTAGAKDDLLLGLQGLKGVAVEGHLAVVALHAAVAMKVPLLIVRRLVALNANHFLIFKKVVKSCMTGHFEVK